MKYKAFFLAVLFPFTSLAVGHRFTTASSGGSGVTTGEQAVLNELSASGGVITVASGLTIADSTDLNLGDNSRVMLDDSGDGFIVDRGAGTVGVLNAVSGGTEEVNFLVVNPGAGTFNGLNGYFGSVASFSGAAATNFIEGLNVAASKDINMADNSRMMIGSSTDGWQMDEGGGRICFIAAGIENCSNGFDLDNSYIKGSIGAFDSIYARAISGPPTFPNNFEINGAADHAALPPSGDAQFWCDTDDDICKITDSSGTDAAITHATINLVP